MSSTLFDTRSDVGRRLDFVWNGPADLPRNMRLEWRLVAVRWLGIGSLAPVLLLAHLPTERLLAAYAVLMVATLYLEHHQGRMWLQSWPGAGSTFTVALPGEPALLEQAA